MWLETGNWKLLKGKLNTLQKGKGKTEIENCYLNDLEYNEKRRRNQRLLDKYKKNVMQYKNNEKN